MSSNRLDKHFAVCAAAVATAVVGSANAAVVYSGVVNITVPANIDGVYIHVESGLTATAGSALAGWDINPYGTSLTGVSLYAASGTGFMRNPGAGTSTSRTNIADGTAIGATSFFYGSSNATIGTLVGQWTANSSGLFGFKFLADDGLTHYGWARLSIGANAATRTIVDYGYESTAGTAIGAGVPAPGAIALLGLAGLVSRRRRN